MTRPATHDLPTDASARPGEREERLQRWAFALMIALLLSPLFLFKYFPTVDGPAHLANATVLLDYHSVPAYQKYFVLNSRPNPNLLGHLILAALLTIFSPVVAEKILIAAYIVLLPTSARYAIRAFQPRAGWAAFLIFPFVYNFPFNMGFYNFSTGLVAWFFFVGYWLRRRENLGIRGTLVIAALGLLLYTCHIFTLALAIVAVGGLGIWFTLVDLLYHRPAWRGFASRGLLTLLGLLPALVMAMLFKLHNGPMTGGRYTRFRDPAFWKELVACQSLVCYLPIEHYIAIGVTVLFAAIATVVLVQKLQSGHWVLADSLIFIVAAYTFLYFVFGDRASGFLYIPHRLRLFIFLAALLWLGAQSYSAVMSRAIALASVGLTLAFFVAHLQAFALFNPQIADYLSLSDRIEKGATFLPVTAAQWGIDSTGQRIGRDDHYIAALMFTGGYVAAERAAIDLRHYEGNQKYFPARFVDELNPYKHLARRGGFDEPPVDVDIPQFERTTTGHVDYVLLYGGNTVQPTSIATGRMEDLHDQLAKDFTLVALSATGHTELWRHR